MITFPKRVWLKTDRGWFSRAADEFDHDANALIAKLMQPGGSLTPEERETLDAYNESLRLEADPLEKSLRAKYGVILYELKAEPRHKAEVSPQNRTTRSNGIFDRFRKWLKH